MDKKSKSFIVLAFGLAVAGGIFWGGTHSKQVEAALSGGYFSFNGNRLSNVAAPQAWTDAATESYVLGAAGASTPANWTCTTRGGYGSVTNLGDVTDANCVGSEKIIAGGCGGTNSNGVMTQASGYPRLGGTQGWECVYTGGGYPGSGGNSILVTAECCQ